MKNASNPEGQNPVGIFRWTAITIVALHVLLYTASIVLLCTMASAMNNAYTDFALKHYMGYLVWQNINILKGYLVISAGYIFLIYPAMRFWLRGRPVRRWGVIWRSTVLTIALLLFFSLRIFQMQPQFLSNFVLDELYYDLLHALPPGLQDIFITGLFTVLPWVGLFATMLSYAVLFKQHRKALSKRKQIAIVAVVAAAPIVCLGLFWKPALSADAVPGAKRPMNVLIIASDSLRADHLSCNGYKRKTSPHIDSLAEKSVNFTHCFTPIGSTLESMTSLMTAQYPHTHGLQHMFPNRRQVEKVNRESPALASILKKQGYDTVVMADWCGAIFHEVPLGFEEIRASDFDNFEIYMTQAIYLNHFIIPLYFDNEFGYWLFPELESFASYLTPQVVTNRVMKRLSAQVRRRRPFFFTVFYSCTHLPYSPPYPYYEMWADPDYDGPNKNYLHFDVDEFINSEDMGEHWRQMAPHEIQHVIDLYDGCVSEFDNCVGQLVEHLKKIGELNNTIIIITSDHGDDLFEPDVTIGHGLTFNGGDQSNRIPLVFYIPGNGARARKVDKITRIIDVAPTILDVLGIEPEKRFEGRSLLPYINGSESNLDLAFYGETSYLFFRRKVAGEEPLFIASMDKTTFIDESFDYHFVLKDKFQDIVLKTKERVLRTEKYKLIYTPGKHYPIYRLFDIEADLHCQKDIKQQEPEIFRKMKTRLWQWINDHKESTITEIFLDN